MEKNKNRLFEMMSFLNPDFKMNEDYTPNPDDISIAKKTSRTQKFDPSKEIGRGFGDAIVPRFAMSKASKTDRVLDFGAGSQPFYVLKYRHDGYNIDGYDFHQDQWEDKSIITDGFNGQYDIVYASNVLNVAPNEEFLKKNTLDKIHDALKPNGLFIGNFPLSPRKNPDMNVADLYKLISGYFNNVEYLRKSNIFIGRK